jgi:membrane protein DedA with SNARE-associated domain
MIEQFLREYGLFAIFGVMLLKEFGIPVPIPADLIMLGVAAQTASGEMNAALGFAALLVPMLLGGLFQYSMARGPGRNAILRIGKLIGLTELRLETMMARVRKGGSAAVALGLTTPGVRIATTPASGLANLPPRRYLPGLLMGSAFFLGWHYAIGYAGGAVLHELQLPLPALIGLIVTVIALGIAATAINRNRKLHTAHQLNGATKQAINLESFASWADASCPVCSALNLLQKDGVPNNGHNDHNLKRA